MRRGWLFPSSIEQGIAQRISSCRLCFKMVRKVESLGRKKGNFPLTNTSLNAGFIKRLWLLFYLCFQALRCIPSRFSFKLFNYKLSWNSIQILPEGSDQLRSHRTSSYVTKYSRISSYKTVTIHPSPSKFAFLDSRGCSYKRVLSTAETWSDVGSLNVAVGNLAVVKRLHYISEMLQNYLCFIQLHC